ncbi:RloB domain-containing protein [Corynebacterium sp. sy017]|uniref:RloB family protein n=1 Tax=unclassified Corynebacterium TaxID=2624378 RepID=UPI001186E1DF|nr:MULTISPECIES: RloB family protein [unclassified Corynebacterium]MBP3088421.1 RloB domain-containing protein [Corynebacterium sp. sy017]TSD91732.1 RloB domain-containing protein [Corynebacterium sp. SY003]
MAARKLKPRTRRGKGIRPLKPTFMLVLQGEVTEKQYFERLRSTFRIPNLHIVVEPHSPERIVSKSLEAIDRHTGSPFRNVFYVVDVDDFSPDQFQQGFSQARKQVTKDTSFHFVVSNPCFEVWLLAHYENIRGKRLSRVLLSSELVKKGAVKGRNKKHIADQFPIENWKTAMKNVDILAFDEHGISEGKASTAIPHLISCLLND